MRAVSAADDPSAAAERARESLREEIERVRLGVDQMLAEQEDGGDLPPPRGRVGLLEERLLRLEGRIDQIEQERRHAEWRMYTNVEKLLDDVLREMRGVADSLARSR